MYNRVNKIFTSIENNFGGEQNEPWTLHQSYKIMFEYGNNRRYDIYVACGEKFMQIFEVKPS
jgi:hypothetical protein